MVPTAVLRAMIVALIRKQPRKDRPNAMLVTTVRCRKKAVRNVSRVVRGRLALGVKIAPWGLLEQEKTIQPNANDATPVLQPQHQAPPAAAGAN